MYFVNSNIIVLLLSENLIKLTCDDDDKTTLLEREDFLNAEQISESETAQYSASKSEFNDELMEGN